MFQYLVFLGAAVNLIGSIFYIKETLKGNVKPNKISWLLWSFPPFIATFAAFSAGAGWAVLPIFMSGFTPLLGFLTSFINKKSYWQLKTFDYLCGFFSLLAIILWAVTKEPIAAIIFSLAGDIFATIPTLKKIWKYPETEYGYAYLGGLFSAITAFAAIKIWNFSSYAFPVYLLIMDGLLTYLIYRPKFFKIKKILSFFYKL
jgi:hypothetical protein